MQLYDENGWNRNEQYAEQLSSLLSFQVTRFSGAVLLMVSEGTSSVSPSCTCWQRTRLEVQYRYRDIYPEAISLVAGGILDLKLLVSHWFKPEDIMDTFATAGN